MQPDHNGIRSWHCSHDSNNEIDVLYSRDKFKVFQFCLHVCNRNFHVESSLIYSLMESGLWPYISWYRLNKGDFWYIWWQWKCPTIWNPEMISQWLIPSGPIFLSSLSFGLHRSLIFHICIDGLVFRVNTICQTEFWKRESGWEGSREHINSSCNELRKGLEIILKDASMYTSWQDMSKTKWLNFIVFYKRKFEKHKNNTVLLRSDNYTVYATGNWLPVQFISLWDV